MACEICSIPFACCWQPPRTASTSCLPSAALAVMARTLDSTSPRVCCAAAELAPACSIKAAVSCAACAHRCANVRTSSATTANPAPAAPERAASTAAFKASKFVWKAMPSMVRIMPEILVCDSPKPCMAAAARSMARPAASTSFMTRAMRSAACSVLWLIWSVVACTCSVAAEVSSMEAACPEAPAARDRLLSAACPASPRTSLATLATSAVERRKSVTIRQETAASAITVAS